MRSKQPGAIFCDKALSERIERVSGSLSLCDRILAIRLLKADVVLGSNYRALARALGWIQTLLLELGTRAKNAEKIHMLL